MSAQVLTYDSAGNPTLVTVYDPGDQVECGSVGPTGVACQRQVNHPGNHGTSSPNTVEWRQTPNGL